MNNIFNKQDSLEIIERINKLSPSTPALWGKMDVAKMLAHCNVTYEFIYTDKHPKPNPFTKLILKLFVKKLVVSNQSYKKNNPTSPAFIITNEKEFETEKVWDVSHPDYHEFIREVNSFIPAQQCWHNLQEFITPVKTLI